MFNKRSLFVFLIVIVIIIAIGALGYKFVWPKLKSQPETNQVTEVIPTTFSQDIVFDGNHYKLDHDIFDKDGHLYISLPDLEAITALDVQEIGEEIIIKNQREELLYTNKIVQNSSAKEDEVSEYQVKEDIIYLPDRHIEKFLGIKVDYFLEKKTNTIALSSASEQQKEAFDQGIGSTIFVHKQDIPLEKYEPRNGLYLGGYVIQDEYIDASMNTFNQLADKKHASYFRYVGYGQPFPHEWVNNVLSTGGFPQIAFEPNDGLEEVVDDEYLRQFAKDAGKVDAPILLRYASEMNGTWTAYSGKSELYIEKWKLVHQIMEEEAPNVMMLWNVFTMPENTIDDFYPGDEYVDYVGVNIYNVMYHNDKLESTSDFEDPLSLLDYVYNAYSHSKPIVIGEFGATNYTVTDGLHHVDFAIEKINRIYKYLPKLYPRVKFIYYFDVNNLVNAPEGRKINNYAITENERITNAYKNSVATDKYLSDIEVDPSTDETFSYRDFFFYYNNELFVDIQFVEDFLQMEVKENNEDAYEVSYDGQNFSTKKESLTIDKSAFFEKREINGISIQEVLHNFELNYEFKENGDLHIYQ